MNRAITRSSSASKDELRIITYYVQQNLPDVAVRFAEALESTLERIAESPSMGSPWESKLRPQDKLRWRPMVGFESYTVFFKETIDGVWIARIFHRSQDIENLI